MLRDWKLFIFITEMAECSNICMYTASVLCTVVHPFDKHRKQ